MTPATEVATAGGTDLLSPEELEALKAQQESEFDSDLFQTPILKIGEPLTKEVQAGEAEAGEFINSVTGEGLGDKIEFVIAYYQKGRFAADRKTGRAYTAFDSLIPEAWADLVGEQFVGTPFAEYPDAEEKYKERVNAKEIEWGHGPLISTTHNYTGLAIVSPPEGSDEEAEIQPVRLSLKRTNVPVVKKWQTLIKSKRNAAIWDYVYALGTAEKSSGGGVSHILTVKQGSPSTPEQRAAAVELAQAVAAGRVSDNQVADAAKPVEPDAKGGLGL